MPQGRGLDATCCFALALISLSRVDATSLRCRRLIRSMPFVWLGANRRRLDTGIFFDLACAQVSPRASP